MQIPSATYRLQFNAAFRFRDAQAILPYLRDLGVSHVYASPLLKARSGSSHGYDVIDPAKINPEIGTRAEFEAFVGELHAQQLGLIVDIVPNHMAASVENPWWTDVLLKGQSSAFAPFFDINWNAGKGKVLLPILPKPYGECLDAGDFRIEKDALVAYGLRLPLTPSSLNNADKVPEEKPADELNRIISNQHYRIAYWRRAADSINYRRFFDVSDLIGLRADRDDVFAATHSTMLDFVQRGWVDGLRIDHIDGLRDPKAYLQRLPSVYVVVEKILGGHESMPCTWTSHGTTGYDFLNVVNGVLIDAAGYDELGRIYADFIGEDLARMDVARVRKRQVMETLFAGEVAGLTNLLFELAARHRTGRDLGRGEIQEALVTVTACLPVYRTYISGPAISDSDRRNIEEAVNAAGCVGAGAAVRFLREVLLIDPAPYLRDHQHSYLDFVERWQQFTGAVMAKGLEDTTFYVFNPLISLNEVGNDSADPSVYFGISEFHQRNSRRFVCHRATMNATSTHDTKRSEDVRARINVLSEIPDEWRRCLARWSRWNAAGDAPDANEQVFIYQTLLGAWPISKERVRSYFTKALREAKTHTSWLDPDPFYEQTVFDFIDRVLDPDQSDRFLRDFLRLQKTLAYFGALNSLTAALLKITAPGIPDMYQGTEAWDLSLADPDNRRPVDFSGLHNTLKWLKRHAKPAELVRHWEDGRLKMFVVWKALNFRRENAATFLDGDYIPLEVTGPRAENVIAFARSFEHRWIVVIVPRLCSQLTRPGKPPVGNTIWSDTTILAPPGSPARFHNIFTGQRLDALGPLANALPEFPVALLASE